MDFSGLIASYRPPSAIEEDVLQSLQRNECSTRPLRLLADCIIHGKSSEFIRDLMEEEDLYPRVNDPITKGLRLIHYAVFQHDIEMLYFLLECGADPNIMDDVGYTPLHICAEKGYSDLIIMLIDYGARIRFTELTPYDKAYGEPPRATAADEPLRLAIRNREHDTAELLLKHGANASAVYYLGQEINLVDPMDLTSLELLLEYGADPNARDLQGLTPLMKACRNPQAVEAVHLLISYGAQVNVMTPDDHRTPLHYAVLAGNLEIVQILVRNEAEINFPLEITRPPPMYFAVMRGNIDILEFLLKSGADINAVSTVVGSALHLALTEKVKNQVQIVRILLEGGANPNAITMTDGKPVLKPPIGEYIHSCEHPNLELVHMLLKYGARIILKGQRDHNLGIIKVIHRIHLGLNAEVMNLLIEATESFNIPFIEQSRQMSDEHKELLLNKALQPFSLQQISRIELRKAIGWGPKFLKAVQDFELPIFLKRYLLFQE